jgi:hypothetical protein
MASGQNAFHQIHGLFIEPSGIAELLKAGLITPLMDERRPNDAA